MTKKLSHCFDFPMHTTKINKLWHKCSKGTTQTTEGKATRIPFQLCKIHLVFPLQTSKQTNRQTVAVQNGSDRYVRLIFFT
jgi:hypothetical protein